MSDIENMSKKMRNKKTAVERPAVKYLKYELAQRPIIDKLHLHYISRIWLLGCGGLLFGLQSKSMPCRSMYNSKIT